MKEMIGEVVRRCEVGVAVCGLMGKEKLPGEKWFWGL